MNGRSRQTPIHAAARRALALALMLALALPLGLFPAARAARAAVYTVNVTTTADSNNACANTGTAPCSLRDAVRFANLVYGVDASDTEIILPEGIYTLTRAGRGEDNAATGDLDIRAALVVRGTNAKTTIIDGNAADRVVDVFPGARLTVVGVTVRNGSVLESGGCFPICFGTGGGVQVAFGGDLSLRYSAVAGSTAVGGGGIYSAGLLQIEQSAIYGNTAAVGAGIISGNTLTVLNSTISGNTSISPPPGITGGGAGLAVGAGTATLTHATIANNTDGIRQLGGTISLRNSIVADSTAGPNCTGTIGDAGYNLDSGATCGFAASGSVSNADPLLDPLGDGRLFEGTPFHGLRFGSAALDRVPVAGVGCPANDQNGQPRPRGAGCDSGSWEESYLTRLGVTPASGPADGATPLMATLTEYTSLLPVAGQTITFYLNGTLAGAAITDASGVAATTGSLAGIAAGTYPGGVSAVFAGDSLFANSGGNAGLTVTATPGPSPTPSPSPSPGTSPSPAPSPSPGTTPAPSAAPTYTLTVTGTAGGTVVGGGSYPAGTVAAAAAAAAPGFIFIGWTFDGVPAGWPTAVTVTMNTNHTLAAAFVPAPAFGDVPGGASYAGPVRELAARGVINGCDATATPPLFCPADPTLRAQMAALIVRAMPGWSAETWPNTFTDPIPDTELWGRVATLQHYGVAQGYQDEVCLEQGKQPPCFGPLDTVKYGQTILFIARAMIEKGYWTLQPDNPALFPELVGTTEREIADHRAVVTYIHYAGAPPDVDASPGVPFRRTGVADGGWGDASSRAWFARALWQALDSYFSVDRVP